MDSSITPINVAHITTDELIEALGDLVRRDNHEIYVGVYDGYDIRDLIEGATQTINTLLNEKLQVNKE
jgi:hypothetical protein